MKTWLPHCDFMKGIMLPSSSMEWALEMLRARTGPPPTMSETLAGAATSTLGVSVMVSLVQGSGFRVQGSGFRVQGSRRRWASA